MTIECLSFYQLSLDLLYEIMKIRQEVFVVEQDCPYLDADDKDQLGWHVVGKDQNGKVIAYTRLLPKGVSYEKFVSIGRVVSSPKARGTGAGKTIMQASLDYCEQLFPQQNIKISAQTYILPFYEFLGFKTVGEEYLEDNIPHIGMVILKT